MPLPPPVTRATSPERSIAMLIGSVRPCVLGEIRLAFLCERGGALFGLVGLQKNVEAVFRQERETTLVVGVGVEGVLQETQCGRAVARDGPAPLNRCSAELISGHDLIDESPALSIYRRVLIEQE